MHWLKGRACIYDYKIATMHPHHISEYSHCMKTHLHKISNDHPHWQKINPHKISKHYDTACMAESTPSLY